jgi:hypothetical protein
MTGIFRVTLNRYLYNKIIIIVTAGAIIDPTLRRKVITAFPLFDFATSLC